MGVFGYRGTGSSSAVAGCGVEATTTPETSIGRGNSALGVRDVQRPCCANMVDVDAKQIVKRYVSHVVHRKHRGAAKLMLDATVHLNGVWGAVIGSDERVTCRINSLSQRVADNAAVGLSA